MTNKTGDVNTEKHIPQIIKRENGYFVKVGKPADHPMTEEHYICEIHLLVDEHCHKSNLKPGDKPEHMFKVAHGEKVTAIETCNIHGTWENSIVE